MFIGVLSTTITFVFAMFILRPIRLLSSDSSCSICCSSCGVSVHRNMSSAKRRLERNYPSIFTPLCSQFNLLNMLSNVAVNSLGEMLFTLYYRPMYTTIQYNTIQYNTISFISNIVHDHNSHYYPNIGMVGKGVDRRIILSWSTPIIN